MALIRFTEPPFFRNPWTEFEKMRRDMEAIMRGLEAGPPRTMVYPAMNISEDNDNVYVKAEIPGVEPDDLEISVESDTLLIKGERKAGPTGEKISFHRREMEHGSFRRAITLPTKVNVDKVEAGITDGILNIVLAKAEEVKPRQIKINVEGQA